MDTVCIDTNVLIWGIKGEHSTGQNDMVSKAQRFLDYLDRQKN